MSGSDGVSRSALFTSHAALQSLQHPGHLGPWYIPRNVIENIFFIHASIINEKNIIEVHGVKRSG